MHIQVLQDLEILVECHDDVLQISEGGKSADGGCNHAAGEQALSPLYLLHSAVMTVVIDSERKGGCMFLHVCDGGAICTDK